MNSSASRRPRFLMLGPATGWHADQLRRAADRMGARWSVVSYESLAALIGTGSGEARPADDVWDEPGANRACRLTSGGEVIGHVDGVLTRTMPAGSLEQITFRLAALHALADGVAGPPPALINPPRGLEIAIDKFASLARLAELGCPVPPTRFAQTREEAIDAFDDLGGDCIIKPLLGGEGRGVMRVQNREMAWYCFSTLERLDAVLQIQQFVPPGGRDTRLLVIGDRVLGVRRRNGHGFRTNRGAGADCRAIEVPDRLADAARQITRHFGLVFAAVDLIDNDHGPDLFLEVNAIPGWRAAQQVLRESVAECVIETLRRALP